VPNTSTLALSNQTLRYAQRLAKDPIAAMRADPVLARGLNTHLGHVTHPGVAEAFGMPLVDATTALAA